jgi:hypothetical protein
MAKDIIHVLAFSPYPTLNETASIFSNIILLYFHSNQLLIIA